MNELGVVNSEIDRVRGLIAVENRKKKISGNKGDSDALCIQLEELKERRRELEKAYAQRLRTPRPVYKASKIFGHRTCAQLEVESYVSRSFVSSSRGGYSAHGILNPVSGGVCSPR